MNKNIFLEGASGYKTRFPFVRWFRTGLGLSPFFLLFSQQVGMRGERGASQEKEEERRGGGRKLIA